MISSTQPQSWPPLESFQQMRALVQANPEILPTLIKQLGASYPKLLQVRSRYLQNLMCCQVSQLAWCYGVLSE
ncbi:unnamed protein product [Schistocephalus solidus]|uniref:XPC-binding domain-containing protein n=1 Tax=Schistocephalus solidus TaxID=70667 RepID=A0A183S9G2_SCHSO|nr:unnamed protein product [Schistocephalus solidus]